MTPLMADQPSGISDHTGRSSVKARLTPTGDGGRSRTMNTPRSCGASYARRVAAGDADALADMTRLATELDEAISQAVTGLGATGYSWAEIAARLGVTRQAAQQHWGRS
jgi:hypothetical protein